MRIVVRYHPNCRDDLRAWLARAPGAVEDRRRLIDNALAELNEELVRTSGHPAGAEYREEPPPPRHWWHFAGDCWVCFTVSDVRGLFARTRTIEVLGFQPEPPS